MALELCLACLLSCLRHVLLQSLPVLSTLLPALIPGGLIPSGEERQEGRQSKFTDGSHPSIATVWVWHIRCTLVWILGLTECSSFCWERWSSSLGYLLACEKGTAWQLQSCLAAHGMACPRWVMHAPDLEQLRSIKSCTLGPCAGRAGQHH